MMAQVVNCAGRLLDLQQPKVMGILNLTPDSFSDGGHYTGLDRVLARIAEMLEQGADIIDIGGESTRPYAKPVSLDEELERVIPIIEKAAKRFDTIISIDTHKPQVMREAVSAGAHMINDINALRTAGAVEAVSEMQNIPLCLMHMQGEPQTMQECPKYENIIADLTSFFQQRLDDCENAGIARDRIILDPGFGFGKQLNHNLALLKQLHELTKWDLPLLVGVSRKRMIGEILDKDVDERITGSIAAGVIALSHGAKLLRVHDVGPTVEAVKVFTAVQGVTERGE